MAHLHAIAGVPSVRCVRWQPGAHCCMLPHAAACMRSSRHAHPPTCTWLTPACHPAADSSRSAAEQHQAHQRAAARCARQPGARLQRHAPRGAPCRRRAATRILSHAGANLLLTSSHIGFQACLFCRISSPLRPWSRARRSLRSGGGCCTASRLHTPSCRLALAWLCGCRTHQPATMLRPRPELH